MRREYHSCSIIGFIGLYNCVIPPFNYSMDFRYFAASHARFGGIVLQVDPAHTAGCGGAQACSALGEVLKMYVFFVCASRFLRKSSGFDLVSQGTCLPALYHSTKIELRCTNFKFGMGTPRKQSRNDQIITFHENRDVRGEKNQRVLNIFLSATGF